MSLQALKEPIAIAARYIPTGGSPCRIRTFPPSAESQNSSRVLAALDAAANHSKDIQDGDNSIEIEGPFPEPLKLKPTNPKSRMPKGTLKPIHPFLGEVSSNGNNVLEPMGSRTTTTQAAGFFESQMSIGNAVAEPMTSSGVEGSSSSIPNSEPTTQATAEGPSPEPFPVYSYKDFTPQPTIVYTQHEGETNDLVDALQGPLGFDMEWRVVWRRGAPERKTALVQLSDKRLILLIQLSKMKNFPQRLKAIIESPEVVKCGANILNDGNKLSRDFGIKAQNLIELGALGRQADPTFTHKRAIVSLADVVAHFTGKSLFKGGKERTSNWEEPLTEKMKEYASNDAHCALMVYKSCMALAAENDITLSASAYTSSVSSAPNTDLHIDNNLTMKHTIAKAATTSGPSPQFLRAYRMWYEYQKPLGTMCKDLSTRGEPLKEGTVISYVIGALQLNTKLPFEMEKLQELIKIDSGSRKRHKEWIATAIKEGRGVRTAAKPS